MSAERCSLPTCLPLSCSFMRVAAKPSQKQHSMYPAYCYNISPMVLRQDIAAFFDGYNLPEDEIRWADARGWRPAPVAGV